MNKQLVYDINLRVSDLIGEDGKCNVDLLQELFPPNEVLHITQLIIGKAKDREVWAYNKSGDYTVKSGSWLLATCGGKRGRTKSRAEPGFI